MFMNGQNCRLTQLKARSHLNFRWILEQTNNWGSHIVMEDLLSPICSHCFFDFDIVARMMDINGKSNFTIS